MNKQTYDVLLDITSKANELPDSLRQLRRDCGDYLTGNWKVSPERYKAVTSESLMVAKQDLRDQGQPELAAALTAIEPELLTV